MLAYHSHARKQDFWRGSTQTIFLVMMKGEKWQDFNAKERDVEESKCFDSMCLKVHWRLQFGGPFLLNGYVHELRMCEGTEGTEVEFAT